MTSPLIFITGSTGFIGSHTVVSALRAGYRVRLSIRRPEQESTLRRLFSKHDSNVEIVVIPDLSIEEAFKSALKDVDYIFHVASPMPYSGKDIVSDYIEPAVKATKTILYAALDFSQIKKVIVMSSAASLVDLDAPIFGHAVFKENSGDVHSVDLSDPRGQKQDPEGETHKYRASKILAHQACRDFVAQEKPHFTLLTFHPLFVLGYDLLQTSSAEIHGMNMSLWMSLGLEKPLFSSCWVHVKDVADAHIKAIEDDKILTGTEFFLSGPVFRWEEAVDFIKKEYPQSDCKLTPPF